MIFITSPVILGTNASKNETIGTVLGRCETFWDVLGFLLYVFGHFGTYWYFFLMFFLTFMDVSEHFKSF